MSQEAKARAWEQYLQERGGQATSGEPAPQMPPWFGEEGKKGASEPVDIGPPGYPPTDRRRVRYLNKGAMEEIRNRPYLEKWQNERRRYEQRDEPKKNRATRMGASQQGGRQHSHGNPSTSSASSSTSWASGPTTSGTSASWRGWSSWSTWTSGAQHRPRHDGGQGPVRQERKARQWADWQQWERAWHTEWSELVHRSGSTPTPGTGEEWSAMLNRHRHRPRPLHDGEEQRDPEQRDPHEPDRPEQPQADQPGGRGQQPEQCQQAEQTEWRRRRIS